MSERWERRAARKVNKEKRRSVQERAKGIKEDAKADARRHSLRSQLYRTYGWGTEKS